MTSNAWRMRELTAHAGSSPRFWAETRPTMSEATIAIFILMIDKGDLMITRGVDIDMSEKDSTVNEWVDEWKRGGGEERRGEESGVLS